ncbi:hypothetical protein HI914_00111 [Erysiphe necator]|nr:hypothetical protein HI914_00111 [Erysiphe necator]
MRLYESLLTRMSYFKLQIFLINLRTYARHPQPKIQHSPSEPENECIGHARIVCPVPHAYVGCRMNVSGWRLAIKNKEVLLVWNM